MDELLKLKAGDLVFPPNLVLMKQYPLIQKVLIKKVINFNGVCSKTLLLNFAPIFKTR